MSESFRKITRERVLAGALLFLVVCFAARLIQLQIFQHGQWRAIAQKQILTTKFQKPSRGEIRDRNGLTLAVTLPLTYAVGYRPKYLLDFNSLSTILSTTLQKPKRELYERLESPGFTYLAHRVDWQTKEKLERMGLTFLQFDEEPRRAYPSGTSAATVIGYTSGDGTGQIGIESVMNDELSGEGYRVLSRVDALRKAPSILTPLPGDNKGADVELTLDLQLQTLIEDQLKAGLKDHSCERACALMVDPKTGAILALVTLPSYDPNKPGDVKPDYLRCWPVTDVYEPGSTLKVVTIAKGLESGKFRRNSRIFCENGAFPVRGAVIHDSHRHGSLTLDEVLALSSNIGTAKVCLQFSPLEFYEKLRAFGFGSLTHIGLAREQAGEIVPPALWHGPRQANMAFGQGVSCTPLQLTMAYAAIANGGLLMKPRIVQSVEMTNGTRTDFAPEVIRRVIPENIAHDLTDMLCGTVEFGTAKQAQVNGIRIAGKTGTAQKADTIHGGYYADRYISSFVGYFPAEDPQYVLLITVDDPRGEHYGGTVAGPIFKNIVEEMRTEIYPGQTPVPVNSAQMVNYQKDQNSRQAVQNQAQIARYNAAVRTAELATLATQHTSAADSTLVTVPSLEGWTLRQAVAELSRRNLAFKMFGSGTVSTQYPPAGTRVAAGTSCELYGVTN
jgi:cell division protein FtsI/penicillin-binding protein 2